ncbi:Flp pilus assembly protein TadD, contains TPR repeats [Sphingomonas gellani]|uniref:Flp pilus assembly protein TadD, contains TPR repeats n=1 Tax=Sphingomonas gellani TaxID=1166340 RepID=A0A1H7ZPA3_9SPHN|nr:tetratricopeptide repeat protein [Sphingomonas gellani]SEM59388.1 Flp pilus assembly protein TadD, contains TPR repeats [Sphingomonas gellani]
MLLAAPLISATPAAADTGGLNAYLRARVASADGRSGAASADYARALADDPANALVAVRAYREAQEAGDEALARRAVAVLDKAGVAPADAALLSLADAARADDPRRAEAAAARLDAGPLRILAPAIRNWTAFARTRSVTAAAPGTADPLAGRLAAETHALVLIAAGRADEGIAAIGAMDATGGNRDLRIVASQILAGQGRIDQARALLIGDSPGEQAYRRGVPARPTLAFGISRLFTRVAGQLSDEASAPLLIALTRGALIADPGDTRARLLLAASLARGEQPDAALGVLAQVKPADPLAGLAAATRISILNGAGRRAEALAASAERVGAPDSTPDDVQRHADLLFAAGRYDEAARFYRRATDALPGNWQAWMQYGGALERAGDWPTARTALQKAVSLAPAEPVALNYLGYTGLEHGEPVGASTRLIERASTLAPDDPDIADSLGWAYHRAGESARALPLLERASAAQPGAAEIGEHLGDVYWALGRRYEARYAWRAAALTAEPADAQRLSEKIADGAAARP